MTARSSDLHDASIIRAAADIIRRRSKRPKSFLLAVIHKTMLSIADDIDAQWVGSCPHEREG